MVPFVAIIVVVPTAVVLATPGLVIVATAVFEESQLIIVVMSCVEWSE